MIVKYLRNLFKQNQRKSKLGSGQSFDEKLQETGVFTYTETGFSLEYGIESFDIAWEAILALNVFKTDLITIDRVEMEIVINDQSIVINEDFAGWNQFVKKVNSVFPTIPQNWDTEIINPPFYHSLRTIYSKETD